MARTQFGEELHGWYFADEVGRLAGVSGDRIGQWARRGYIRSSRSSKAPRKYAYQDVAEAILVHALLESGAPLKSVRKTVEHLRDRYGDWPLQNAQLVISGDSPKGSRRVHYREGDFVFDASKTFDQLVNTDLTDSLVAIVRTLTRGGWASRYLPDLEHVEIDPLRMSGRPAVRGRRVAIEDVIAILNEEANGRDLLKTDYGLTDAQIDDAEQWWEASNQFDIAA